MSQPNQLSESTFVISRKGLPSLGALFLLSAFWGLVVLLVDFGLTFVSKNPQIGITLTPALWIIAMSVVAIVWPIWRLRRRYRTIVTTPRAAWVGFGYGMGIFGLPLGLAIGGEATETSGHNYVGFLVAMLPLSMLATVIVVTIAWLIVRLTLPKFILQDGTRCPTCAHCILGVQSMRCPECGEAFTFESIETTELEFLERTNAM